MQLLGINLELEGVYLTQGLGVAIALHYGSLVQMTKVGNWHALRVRL